MLDVGLRLAFASFSRDKIKKKKRKIGRKQCD